MRSARETFQPPKVALDVSETKEVKFVIELKDLSVVCSDTYTI